MGSENGRTRSDYRSSLRSSWTNMQEAATLATRLVGIGVEAKPCCLKQAHIDLSGNPAERGYLVLR